MGTKNRVGERVLIRVDARNVEFRMDNGITYPYMLVDIKEQHMSVDDEVKYTGGVLAIMPGYSVDRDKVTLLSGHDEVVFTDDNLRKLPEGAKHLYESGEDLIHKAHSIMKEAAAIAAKEAYKSE